MIAKPDPWQTNAPGPFLWVGEVSMWVLPDQRFRIQAASGGEVDEGFAEARGRARELAGLDAKDE